VISKNLNSALPNSILCTLDVCMVGRKNVNITPWWVAMLRTLRTTALNYCLSCSTIPCCMLCIFGGRIYVVKREKPLKSKEGYNISKKVFSDL